MIKVGDLVRLRRKSLVYLYAPIDVLHDNIDFHSPMTLGKKEIMRVIKLEEPRWSFHRASGYKKDILQFAIVEHPNYDVNFAIQTKILKLFSRPYKKEKNSINQKRLTANKGNGRDLILE